MNGRKTWFETFGTVLMFVCFGLAFGSLTVATLTVFPDGKLTGDDLAIAGVGLGSTGVWVALSFFVYAEKARQEFEACLEERLDDMVERLEKCECKCQPESAA